MKSSEIKTPETPTEILNRHLVLCGLCLALFLPLAMSTTASAVDHVTADGPGSYRLADQQGVVRFPFDIHRGDIRFQARINGHDVHLLLDDGFMWDQLLFWGGPAVDALGLNTEGEILVGKEGDENALASTLAEGITLSLPGVEFTDQTAVITPASSGNSTMWSGSIGQVSATFFKHFVVDINFDTMMITLIEPNAFEYQGDGVAVPWRPLPFGAWSIPGTLQMHDGREVAMELMMDLGYNDQAQIATDGEHGFTAPPDADSVSLGLNIQRQETRAQIGRIPGIEIGGFVVEGVPCNFVVEEHADHTYPRGHDRARAAFAIQPGFRLFAAAALRRAE